MGKSAKTLSLDSQLLVDMEKESTNYDLSVHRMFEAGGVALLEKIRTGRWPKLDTLIQSVKEP